MPGASFGVVRAEPRFFAQLFARLNRLLPGGMDSPIQYIFAVTQRKRIDNVTKPPGTFCWLLKTGAMAKNPRHINAAKTLIGASAGDCAIATIGNMVASLPSCTVRSASIRSFVLFRASIVITNVSTSCTNSIAYDLDKAARTLNTP